MISLLRPIEAALSTIKEGLTTMTDTVTEEAPAEVQAEAPETPKDRAASLQATRQQKMDELFRGKKYEIFKEVHLEGDNRFETPFGNKGRHGFALREVGNPDNKFIVGATMLQQVAEQYGAVEVPAKDRKRRTKEQKAADDAKAAEEKAAAASKAAEQVEAAETSA
jgi:hypothetical protein